jgi:hypothetical protein
VSLLLRNALLDGAPADVLIRDGVIASLTPAAPGASAPSGMPDRTA